MLLLNKQTRTSTVLEYPGKNDWRIPYIITKACIISVGVNTEVIAAPPSVKTHIHLIEK